MEFIIIYSFFIAFIGAVGWIKNYLTYRIRSKWIEEVFDHPDWNLLRHKLPEYGATFWDMKLWTYISFEDYLKSKEKQ